MNNPALLLLEDGTAYEGWSFGALGTTVGEIVFNTGMTGYQETLTDPSYRQQIVVMTAPHIGNTGMNDEDNESDRIQVAGFVVRDPSPRASNWRSKRELTDVMVAEGIVGIQGIDTRALTLHLRDKGVMRAGIASGPSIDTDALLTAVLDSPSMSGASLAEEVSTQAPYTVPAVGDAGLTVTAVDLGIKAMTPRRFAQRGVTTIVLPATATFEEIMATNPDGVFFSNGPGDPEATDGPVEVLSEVLRARIPFFGICLGNQLLARALGFDTYKLTYGHRGINQPVLDRATGRIAVTSHNHGFAADVPLEGPVTAPNAEFGRVEVSFIALNDQVVEGIRCLDIPAFSVQFHPESAAGPHDANYLFDEFITLITGNEQAERSEGGRHATAN